MWQQIFIFHKRNVFLHLYSIKNVKRGLSLRESWTSCMSYPFSAPHLKKSLGCYNMVHTCNGECPLALYARRESPALMWYGNTFGLTLSGLVLRHLYRWCYTAISLVERSAILLMSLLPWWDWLPIMFRWPQRRHSVQFNQQRGNASRLNQQLISLDRFHLIYQGSIGIFGLNRLEAQTWWLWGPTRHLSRFIHAAAGCHSRVITHCMCVFCSLLFVWVFTNNLLQGTTGNVIPSYFQNYCRDI